MPENEPEKEPTFASWKELAGIEDFRTIARTKAFSVKLKNGKVVNFIFENEQLRPANLSQNNWSVEVSLVPGGARDHLKTREIVSISYQSKGYGSNFEFD